MKKTCSIAIVGGGLVGCVLARLLARRGHPVHVFERRPDPGALPPSAGRSTHLVLSARGWKALDAIGARPLVLPATLPLRGRRIHTSTDGRIFQPYGEDGQTIHAIHRHTLHRLLARLCADTPGVTLHFGQRCVEVDAATGRLDVQDVATQATGTWSADWIFAADGAFSGVRRTFLHGERFDYAQTWESFGYKELTIPASHARGLEDDAMHAWPRGPVSFFAFPNPDGSFTATLLAPFEGPDGFASIRGPEDVARLFDVRFPDVDPAPFIDELLHHPCNPLVSIRCAPWVHGGRVALIGDAAHAMVPFLGQGMNAGFEDCTVLCELLDAEGEDFEAVLPAWEALRRPDCDAVTTLSSRAFDELTRQVGDPRFHLRKQLESRIHRLYPQRFVPPYHHLAFTHAPYARVLRGIEELDGLVDALMRDPDVANVHEPALLEARIHALVLGHSNSH